MKPTPEGATSLCRDPSWPENFALLSAKAIKLENIEWTNSHVKWGVENFWSGRRWIGKIGSSVGKEAVMEWVVKLETRNGWGEVETIEVGRLERRVSGLTADEVGMTLAEGKNLLGELGRLILQTQMEEFITRARVCGDCLKLRRLRGQRTRKVQTLFGRLCHAGISLLDVGRRASQGHEEDQLRGISVPA
jgi:hypothetical protein